MEKREIKVKIYWNGFVSLDSYTIGQFWDRDIEMEFKGGDTLPFGDIDWEEDDVFYLQFTGLKDNNLQEIYEHDILQYEDVDEIIEVGTVEWDNRESAWHFISKESDCAMGRHFVGCGAKFKKIGNAYENPEFLTGGKK